MSHTAANALDKATPPDVPVLRVSLEINNVPTPPVPLQLNLAHVDMCSTGTDVIQHISC